MDTDLRETMRRTMIMKKENSIPVRNSLLLLLTATIWGVAFVAQSVSMDYIGGFTFNAVRNLIGALALLPVIKVLDKTRSEAEKKCESSASGRKTLLIGGICCGIMLCLAGNFQQFGIKYTTVGKAGFITACYIIIVPIIGIFLQKKCSPFIWIAVLLSLCGLYLLCLTPGEGLAVGKGELLLIICAVLFSGHILVIDHFSPLVDGIKMSCIQFFTCSILSAVCMALFKTVNVSNLLHAWIPILYAGILSSGVGYTLQIIGQKGLNPTMASLLMSLESVFSVLAGWIFLHQALSGRELSGCILMFAAIVLVQLPGFSKTNAVS